MKPDLRGSLIGAALSLPTLALGAWLPYYLAVGFFAVLLGVTAGVYLGFALQDGRRLVILAETVLLLPFMLLAIAALSLNIHLLAFGFFLHGLWDLAHHLRAVQTRLVPWYPPACLVFDWIVAAFIFFHWR
ncbi:MAG TPA: DUF6010 family protein [Candidatus Acidoferrales bacterium]|nr:DUF6010 family protein [Candidatus Acidoferrales bacterium]